jgi:two-component system response regulator DevR
MTGDKGAFLLVDDDSGVLRSLSRVFRSFAAVHCAESVSSARAHLRAGVLWRGFVIDLNLPDGSGLDLLERIRDLHPRVPALVLTGSEELTAINHVFALQASYCRKPAPTAALTRFAREAVASRGDWHSQIAGAVAKVAAEYGLTTSEARIVDMSVRGVRPESILLLRDISENTYKTQVKSILVKTQTSTLGTLRDIVLRSLSGENAFQPPQG